MSIAHDSFPHTPGELYDCPACYSECHCEELREDELYAYDEETVCVHCQMENERFRERVARLYARTA